MKGLLAIDRAIDHLLGRVRPLAAEQVAVAEAAGRTVARPLFSPTAHPRADNSAMDGYALRRADGRGPRRLLAGEAAAGAPFSTRVGPDEAVRIFTGGQLPTGADAVVIQENASVEHQTLTFSGDLVPHQNVRRAGGDLATGAALLGRGRRLTPTDLGGLAGLGIDRVWVTSAPRVAIFATGDELVAPGAPAASYQVYESNGLTLAALGRAAGAQVSPPVRLPDNPDVLAAALATAITTHDLVLFAGGASVGDHDHVPEVLRAAGGDPLFYKVRMKPGKPVIATRIGRCQVLGLPGNPISAVTAHQVFVAPLIRTLCGSPEPFVTLRACVLGAAASAGRRTQLLRGSERRGVVHLKARQGSGDLSSLFGIDGFAVLPASDRRYVAGDRVGWWPLDGPPSSVPPEAQLRALGLC